MSGTRAGRQVQRDDRVDTRTRKQHSTSRVQGARIELDECSSTANGRGKREGGEEGEGRDQVDWRWVGSALLWWMKRVLGSRAQSGIGEETLGFTWSRPGGDGRWQMGEAQENVDILG